MILPCRKKFQKKCVLGLQGKLLVLIWQRMKTQTPRPTDKHIYRASAGTRFIGHFTSMTAAMKALPVSVCDSDDGYVDVYDPTDTIMPGKGAGSDGYKLIRHRVVDGGVGNNGWFWND